MKWFLRLFEFKFKLFRVEITYTGLILSYTVLLIASAFVLSFIIGEDITGIEWRDRFLYAVSPIGFFILIVFLRAIFLPKE